MSLRDQILSAPDRKRVPVEVPEWGCTVHVQSMTGREREHYERLAIEARKTTRGDVRARLLVFCATDEDGKLLFDAGHVEALSQKSAVALDRLVDVAAKLNGIGDQAVEDKAKNSPASPSDSSSSDSPSA